MVWVSCLNNHDTERCSNEDYLSIPNCVDEYCAGPGEYTAKRLINKGKEGRLSVPQRSYLFKQLLGNRLREGSHSEEC